jgi:hypothetical protein
MMDLDGCPNMDCNLAFEKFSLSIYGIFWILSSQTIFMNFAAGQTTSGEADKIKTLLLRPAGWISEWGRPGGNIGLSDYINETRGEKVVVKI